MVAEGAMMFYGRAVGEVFGHYVRAGGKIVTVDDLDGGGWRRYESMQVQRLLRQFAEHRP
jgi:hypothetical protein